MFEVVADLSCENRTCPFLAVDPETGDVVVQGRLTRVDERLPAQGPGEARLRFTAAEWAALTGR